MGPEETSGPTGVSTVSRCSHGLGLDQTSSGFVGVQILASAHALHLPTNSVQIFQVELNFRLSG